MFSIFSSFQTNNLRCNWVEQSSDGAARAADRHPNVYPGSYIEYVQKPGHEAPGIYS